MTDRRFSNVTNSCNAQQSSSINATITKKYIDYNVTVSSVCGLTFIYNKIILKDLPILSLLP